MSKLTDLTIAEALDGLKAKQFSAVELTEAHIRAVEATNPHINAYITQTPGIARKQAAEADARYAKGEARRLDGVPIAMKDLFCTRDVLTTASSHILDGFKPKYESTVSANLWRDGAVMLGKVGLDEFAMGSSSNTNYYGTIVNPWSPWDGKTFARKLVPGGSSGGSSAAVAARCAMGATGTDTGGSIRQPASFTGISGIKPTYGRCSRWGIIAFASSLDQAGPMARTVKDCALMLESMAGHDKKDSTSVDMPVPDWAKKLGPYVKGKRIGIPKEYRVDGIPAEIDALWMRGAEWLKAQGAEIVDISLPHTKYALPVYYIIAPAECSSNLARYDGVKFGLRVDPNVNGGGSLADMYKATRAAGFGKEVRRRILIGTYVLSAGYYDAYYNKALCVRAKIAEDFRKAFESVDAILTPTAPSTAFEVGANEDDPVKMYLNDVFTIPASLAGLPCMSVPAGLGADGLPLGLHIIGKPFDEQTVLDVSQAIEIAAAFAAQPVFKAA
jgi:aspartyl-tRNA(Asn)/glutamyl-tRNA(Gln) amidotransferase subunit A